MNIKQTEVIIGENKFVFFSDSKIVSHNDTNVFETLENLYNNSYLPVEATGVNAYTANNNKIKSLSKYTRLTLFVASNATGNCTINLNNFGAKNIKDSFGNIVNNLKANIPYNIMYNGTDFILQGKGGGGNATTAQLLEGKTATVDGGPITGTMHNYGTFGNPAASSTVWSNRLYMRINSGYYGGGNFDGGGNAEAFIDYNRVASLGEITPEKVVQGNNIYGVIGTGKSFSSQYKINPWLYTGTNAPESCQQKVALYNKKIYCFGKNSTNIKIYDIENNSWSNGASIPNTMYDPAIEIYNGKIYMIAGAYERSNVQIYDIANNSWTTGKDIPYGGTNISSVLLNGKIYCLGGDRTGNTLSHSNYVQIYDIANNTWNYGTNSTYKFHSGTSVVYNTKIYCLGGTIGSNAMNYVQIYDTSTNRWSRGTDMHDNKFGASSVIVGDNIYCLGGCDGNGTYYSINEKYNISTNTWSSNAIMPTGKKTCGCIVYDNKIFTIGGDIKSGSINNVEIYDISFE